MMIMGERGESVFVGPVCRHGVLGVFVAVLPTFVQGPLNISEKQVQSSSSSDASRYESFGRTG
jgi:hypothetical protein